LLLHTFCALLLFYRELWNYLIWQYLYVCASSSALMLLVEMLSVVVVWLRRGADLHMAQLMPLPLIVTCFGKNWFYLFGTSSPG